MNKPLTRASVIRTLRKQMPRLRGEYGVEKSRCMVRSPKARLPDEATWTFLFN